MFQKVKAGFVASDKDSNVLVRERIPHIPGTRTMGCIPGAPGDGILLTCLNTCSLAYLERRTALGGSPELNCESNNAAGDFISSVLKALRDTGGGGGEALG